MPKLFACYVGGRNPINTPKCNIELHDVIFAVGNEITDCYDQIKSKWFGSPERLHLDCYLELESIDGYEIKIGKSENDLKLYFTNCGGYSENYFGEIHKINFVVAKSLGEAIKLVKNQASKEYFDEHSLAHFDDKFDVDDCFQIPLELQIAPSQDAKLLKPIILGYHRIN